jgi:hypothetical protein
VSYVIGKFHQLQRWVGVLHQHLEVSIEPCSCLRSWLQSISLATVVVVSSSGSIACTVAFTARLDPNEGINLFHDK